MRFLESCFPTAAMQSFFTVHESFPRSSSFEKDRRPALAFPQCTGKW
jgi:hypothetical protein